MIEGDTIAAISTPLGEGGIGVIRLSGPEAVTIARQLFAGPGGGVGPIQSHRAVYGHIIDPATGKRVDEALMTVMLAPRSFTREDVVELSCHGGVAILQKTLQLILDRGARLAEPGEFTRRAFLNGRINLIQAEAVIDLIRAKSEASRQVAMDQLAGGLSAELSAIRALLIAVASRLEVSIDFPEDELDVPRAPIEADLDEACRRLQSLSATFDQGRILREGLSCAIVGRPNVGKSTLLNALLGYNRAIVSPQPGTTRDTIEEAITLQGAPVRLSDTAGLRTPDTDVEEEGVRRTRQAMAKADLVLMVVDGADRPYPEDVAIVQGLNGKPAILVINKVDLRSVLTPDNLPVPFALAQKVWVSAKERTGLDRLRETMVGMTVNSQGGGQGGWATWDGPVVTRLRHHQDLVKAEAGARRALQSFRQGIPDELVAHDLSDALVSLDSLLGLSFSEEVLERIFRDFCIGK